MNTAQDLRAPFYVPPTDADTWAVVVEVPANAPREIRDRLFDAVAEAAQSVEPADRDGWDLDVYGCPLDEVGR